MVEKKKMPRVKAHLVVFLLLIPVGMAKGEMERSLYDSSTVG